MANRANVPWAADVALAVALAGLGLAEVWVPFTSLMGDASPVVSSVAVLVLCGAIVFRRVRPLVSTLVVLFGWVALDLASTVHVMFWGQFVPMSVAVFSVARHGSTRQGAYGAVAGALTLTYFDLFVAVLQGVEEQLFHWGVFLVAWLAGRGLWAMERRARDAAAHAVAVESLSREQTLAAVANERARIARELHDVVAHAMSVMVVQAGAAEQVVDENPQYARSALVSIRGTGTSALAEMRRLVAMLRDDEQTGALAPQPGLQELPSLLADVRSAGLGAELDVEGEERALPAGLDLAVYRIVQEALTNVVRHAAATQVRVALRYRPEEVEVEVRDDGAGLPGADPDGARPDGRRAGHGLIGMRERAALYDGTLETTSEPGGGFTVRAVLPVARV